MNLTQLEIDCKKVGRKCFEDFKHKIQNHPDFCFGKLDKTGMNETIKNTILQEFGRKVLKNHITGNESKIQLVKIQNIVNEYKDTIVKTAITWGKKYLES